MQAQLRWVGHVSRMGDERIPKALLFGQLEEGRRSHGGQRKRYKDVLKVTLKSCWIDPATWEVQASHRAHWRKICHEGTCHFVRNRTAHFTHRAY